MSQTPTQACPSCRAQIAPGLTFCPNCGTMLSAASNYYPTVASTPPAAPSGSYDPTVAAPPPAAQSPENSNYGQATPPPPPSSSSNPNQGIYTHYPAPGTPPPPPQQYQQYQSASGNNPYTPGTYGYPYGQQQGKRRGVSPWLYIGIAIALVVLIGGFFAIKGLIGGTGGSGGACGSGGAGGSGGTANTSKITPSNLAFTYASDNITVTSIQQASKFSDDASTTYGSSKNYVRVNFNESATAKYVIVDYLNSFHLMLPDNTLVKPTQAKQYSAPDGVAPQVNWIDFGTDSSLDLNTLGLRVGAAGEVPMVIPFKTGANLAQYQDKTVKPGSNFTYGPSTWTIVSATRSLSFNGKQATTGNIYISVNLKVKATGNYALYGVNGDFIHLKVGGNTYNSDLGSQASDFDDIEPGTTHQGTVTYLATPASDGNYTLYMEGTKDNVFPSTNAHFQLS
ncbi:MAG TPA: zinc ribbon domain-containing protein [Ktedonobacteraceae bacterium]|nr:zinc ribbon domain-containing protein [Ktedonobacteraceae bacterium]